MPAAGQEFDFTLGAPSGLTGQVDIAAATAGTLIGNWDPATNPTGTRTKPGLFGTFGPMENEPVAVQVGPQLAGPIQSSASGTFSTDLFPATGTLLMRDYSADLLASGPVGLPITLTLLYESFRTRNPSSVYPGGAPVPLPFGEATLTQLTAAQAAPAPGTLTPTAPGQYDFSVVVPVVLSASFTILGNAFELPAAPAAIALAGTLAVSGSTATLDSSQPFEFSITPAPGVALPQFPLDLPTVLPPGSVAHLLLDLTLEEVSASVSGVLRHRANGVLVPAPGFPALGLLVALGAACRRRGAGLGR